jgi:hypothetical protein
MHQESNNAYSLTSPSVSMAVMADLFSAILPARLSRAALFFVRRASIWSARTLVRDCSALALWMWSIKTRLFLKTFPWKSKSSQYAVTPTEDGSTHLCLHVELVVAGRREQSGQHPVQIRPSNKQHSQVTVDLAVLPVLSEHPPEHTLPAHPEHLGGHPGLSRSLPLSGSSVPSLGLGRVVVSHACARVDDLGLDNDVSIVTEATDAVQQTDRQYLELAPHSRA